MYLRYLKDPRFFELLYKIDKDTAYEHHKSPCLICNKPLHFANYKRKARCIEDEFLTRFSLCCSSCRKRTKVPSILFFNSFVYGSIFFFIISCFINGNGHRYKRLSSIFKVSDRTLRRWKRWWDNTFKETGFWKELSGLIKPSVDLPLDIVQQFFKFEDFLKYFAHFNHRASDLRNRC